MQNNYVLHNIKSPCGISFTVSPLLSWAGELILTDRYNSGTNPSPQAWCLHPLQ